MTDAKPFISIDNLANEAIIHHAGFRDQIEILEEKKWHGARPPEQIAHMRERLRLAYRTAYALDQIKRHREELPRWVIALFENGEEPPFD
jgi:hypothetical protein